MKEVFHFSAEHKEAIGYITRNALIMPIAREIHKGEFSPNHKFTPEELLELIKSSSLSLEFYTLPVVTLEDVDLCLDAERFMSAAMLLYATIEGIVNGMIRVLLYVQGFSHREITSLQYTGLTPKINVILPLLNNPLPEQIKRWVKRLREVRNLGTHDKALPIKKGFLTKDSSYDHEKKAKELFDEMNIEDLRKGVDKFYEGIYLASPEIRTASEIVGNEIIEVNVDDAVMVSE